MFRSSNLQSFQKQTTIFITNQETLMSTLTLPTIQQIMLNKKENDVIGNNDVEPLLHIETYRSNWINMCTMIYRTINKKNLSGNYFYFY